MIVKQQKRSTTVNVISWTTALRDDMGIQFATMTGSLDAAHPLGQVSFTVHNAEVYLANAEEAREVYEAFVKTVSDASAGFVGNTVTCEGDDLHEDDEPMMMEEV